ncbi:MAG: N-6 DNA methylase, partial [Methanomassiliicoccaceae archaeon]|nr:N-6 DNA methylase [Methanomassiliicoccaceae archaeon]
MPQISDIPSDWNIIRTKAAQFVIDHKDDHSEDSHKQLFWRDFFAIFDVPLSKVGSYEAAVKKVGEGRGKADYLWKGTLIIEQKSLGKDLDVAFQQANDYTMNLTKKEMPRYIIVSDFKRLRMTDLEEGSTIEFELKDLTKNIERFGFIAGYEMVKHEAQDPVNIKAAEEMAKLHDSLKEAGYSGHELEVYLVRLVFCLFAENTGIFDEKQFYNYINTQTTQSGAELAGELEAIFQILDQPKDKRMKNIPELLMKFPYVNGELFRERLSRAHFNSEMRTRLINSSKKLDWSKISPAIFGSLFQGVMNPVERRELGAHYTSEENIMKLIKPLFLDDLREEFSKISDDKRKLDKFWDKLASIRILDPACGCGNFLIIAYRELRLLEIEVMAARYGKQTTIGIASKIDVDQFYGFEIEDFPSEIARVAMWLMDHLMNLRMRDEFGIYEPRIPLKASANIFNLNSLEEDWTKLVKPKDLTYIIGNPPFVGSKYQDDKQRKEMASLFPDGAKILDYVSAWYLKAADYMAKNPNVITGFVSTNSITQGEQVEPLWKLLFGKGVKIHFAYPTFKWSNEAKGKAAVHCVIIGFGLKEPQKRTLLYHGDGLTGQVISKQVKHINPYLVDADNIFLERRSKPLCDVPIMSLGNQPIDGGNYLFTLKEKDEFIKIEPQSEKYFRPWVGSEEFINGFCRYFLFLRDCSPTELRSMPEAKKRVEAVEKFRLESKRKVTRDLAKTPREFAFSNISDGTYIVVPEVSSERRKYIPIGFLTPNTLCSNLVKIIPNATLYHFGILTSSMHMAWTRAVCGRLKSDFRYSTGIVYNNFPWPDVTEKQKESTEKAAKGVLDVRSKYPNSSLADLYDPLSMPADLVKAHSKLDREVEKAY